MIGDLGLRVFTTLFAAGDPNPTPSGALTSPPPDIDPNRVTPGGWGAITFVALLVVTALLYFSLRKQMRRVDFDEDKINEQLAAEEAAKKAAHQHRRQPSE